MADEQPPPSHPGWGPPPPPDQPEWGAPPPPGPGWGAPPPEQPQWGAPPPPGYGQQPGYGQMPPPPPPPGYGSPTYGYVPYGSPMVAHASFGARLGALLLDGVIVAIPAVVLYGLAALVIGSTCDSTYHQFTGRERLDCGGSAAPIAAVIVVGIAAYVLLTYFYFIRPIARGGQTIGMKAVNIRVVDADTGGPIGTGRSVGRYLMQSFISGAICYLGYLWMLWDDRSQTWHDKVANSVVVTA